MFRPSSWQLWDNCQYCNLKIQSISYASSKHSVIHIYISHHSASYSFENLVKPASEPSQACVELLRDADTINPGQLDSAVYKAFKVLQGTDTDMSGEMQ